MCKILNIHVVVKNCTIQNTIQGKIKSYMILITNTLITLFNMNIL